MAGETKSTNGFPDLEMVRVPRRSISVLLFQYFQVSFQTVKKKERVLQTREYLVYGNWFLVWKMSRASVTLLDMVFSPSLTQTLGSKYFLFGLSAPSGLPTMDMM